jgi:hypothetical protein
MSEPYTIIDSKTRETIQQRVSLEQSINDLWRMRGEGKEVELIGTQDNLSEKRLWGQ